MIAVRASAAAVTLVGAAAYASEAEFETVIVTSEKRFERRQDVLGAVSTLIGGIIEAMGAQSFMDYTRSIPGLTVKDARCRTANAHLRGINRRAGVAANYHIEETPTPTAPSPIGGFAVNPRRINIDRIEVLRGPQGGLYGSISTGAMIKPIPEGHNLSRFEGSVKTETRVTLAWRASGSGADRAYQGGVAAVRCALSGLFRTQVEGAAQ
jgi:outer membrane receptor protein involved in Fe transport